MGILHTECENSIPLFFLALSRLTISLTSPKGVEFLFRETDHPMKKYLQIGPVPTKLPYSKLPSV